jgi:hypothetical protein
VRVRRTLSVLANRSDHPRDGASLPASLSGETVAPSGCAGQAFGFAHGLRRPDGCHGGHHLLGFDHEPFADRYAGCNFRRTGVHGKAVNEIIA